VKEAVDNGAICLVVEKYLEFDVEQIIVPDVREAMGQFAKEFYGAKVDEMRVVGVVGTNGKTTCAHIMKHIFETAGEEVGILGTLHGKLTTPDPIDLHKAFAKMYDDGIRTVVMEATAHAIHFKKLTGITFEAVIFTNITQDHLDFFGTFENYANTKINFFLQGDHIKTAIVNIDNEFGQRIIKERKAKSIPYSLEYNKFETNLLARFNAENVAGCGTCARALGISEDHIKAALISVPQIPGRFNVYKVGEVTAIVDFAHSPDGLEKIILAVREFAKGKIITVFGCGGNRDKEKRPIMGEISARLSDFTVITSDNPRFERPIAIMKQIRKGFRAVKCKNFIMIKDRADAICLALELAEDGDVVIVAGKGGETHTEIKGKMIEYTDSFVITTHINFGLRNKCNRR
jgi:UDP-N-acetylmuramoyl-L-alanyl-D-glutamate--2,6-diaminopimelate ligase